LTGDPCQQFAASFKTTHFQQVAFHLQHSKVILQEDEKMESVYDLDSLLAVTNGSCCLVNDTNWQC